MIGEEWGDRPLLLAVDGDSRQLSRIEGELQRSFGADFRIRGESLPEDAVRTLQGANRRQERVAVVLVDDGIPDDVRAEIFATARTLHPDARRALLVAWGAWAHPETAQKILKGMAVGDISYYVLKPWIKRDEFFHRTIAEFVTEWARSEPSNLREVVVVAAEHTGRAYAVRDLLAGTVSRMRFVPAPPTQGNECWPGPATRKVTSWSGCLPSAVPAWWIRPTPRSWKPGHSDRVARDGPRLRPPRGGCRSRRACYRRVRRFRRRADTGGGTGSHRRSSGIQLIDP